MDNVIVREIFGRLMLTPADISNLNIPSEYFSYLKYLPMAGLAFILTLFLAPIIGHIATKLGATYKPGVKRLGKVFDNISKHRHQYETPGLGGLAVTLPLLVAIPFMFQLNDFTWPFFIAIAVLIVGALLDDLLNLPAIFQLLYQGTAALIIATSIIDLPFIGSPLTVGTVNLNWLDLKYSVFGVAQSIIFPGDFFMLLWILICINAIKWVGGSPGLVEANSFITFIILFIIGVRGATIFVSSASIMMAGSLLALIIFAFPPQKIMSGSSGKTLYGFLIASLAVVNGAKLATAIMVLLLPLIDFFFVIGKRFLKYKPKSIIELLRMNDTSHLHHQLLELKLTERQVLLIEASLTLLIGAFAIFTTGALRLFLLVAIAFIFLISILLINMRADKQRQNSTPEKGESPESKYSY